MGVLEDILFDADDAPLVVVDGVVEMLVQASSDLLSRLEPINIVEKPDPVLG